MKCARDIEPGLRASPGLDVIRVMMIEWQQDRTLSVRPIDASGEVNLCD